MVYWLEERLECCGVFVVGYLVVGKLVWWLVCYLSGWVVGWWDFGLAEWCWCLLLCKGLVGGFIGRLSSWVVGWSGGGGWWIGQWVERVGGRIVG